MTPPPKSSPSSPRAEGSLFPQKHGPETPHPFPQEGFPPGTRPSRRKKKSACPGGAGRLRRGEKEESMEPFPWYDFPRLLSTKCLKKITFQTLSPPATLRKAKPRRTARRGGKERRLFPPSFPAHHAAEKSPQKNAVPPLPGAGGRHDTSTTKGPPAGMRTGGAKG